MATGFQARWASKDRAEALRRAGQGMILDSFNGFIVIELTGSRLADGDVLSAQEADFELQPAWCLEKPTRLRQARRMIGLEIEEMAGAGA
jgi:hypothetical protein